MVSFLVNVCLIEMQETFSRQNYYLDTTPPPKNVERVIYEFVDRDKVLYFLCYQADRGFARLRLCCTDEDGNK